MQAALCYPRERAQREASIRMRPPKQGRGEERVDSSLEKDAHESYNNARESYFPYQTPPAPLLIYSAPQSPCAARGTFPERHDSNWSNFYSRFQRQPQLSNWIPWYNAARYKQVAGHGQVGWGPGVDPDAGFAPLRPEER